MRKEYCGMPMRFAHTGVTQFAPENTLEAFQKAAELGCEGIEMDIQISGDGEIIVTADAHAARSVTYAYGCGLAQVRSVGYHHTMILTKDGFKSCTV